MTRFHWLGLLGVAVAALACGPHGGPLEHESGGSNFPYTGTAGFGVWVDAAGAAGLGMGPRYGAGGAGSCPSCGAAGRRSPGEKVCADAFGDEANIGEVVLGPCSSEKPLCQWHDGRSWSEEAPETLTHDEATAYCAGLGGRLPTISELRTLLHNCTCMVSGGRCTLSDTCSSKKECLDATLCAGCGDGGRTPFGADEAFWTSTAVSDEPGKYWQVVFRYSRFRDVESTDRGAVFCIDNG